jgi:hypothetical protein
VSACDRRTVGELLATVTLGVGWLFRPPACGWSVPPAIPTHRWIRAAFVIKGTAGGWLLAVGFALWTRVSVMRGRSTSSGIGQSTFGPEQPSPAETVALTWTRSRKRFGERRRRSSWRGGDTKINGMTA